MTHIKLKVLEEVVFQEIIVLGDIFFDERSHTNDQSWVDGKILIESHGNPFFAGDDKDRVRTKQERKRPKKKGMLQNAANSDLNGHLEFLGVLTFLLTAWTRGHPKSLDHLLHKDVRGGEGLKGDHEALEEISAGHGVRRDRGQVDDQLIQGAGFDHLTLSDSFNANNSLLVPQRLWDFDINRGQQFGALGFLDFGGLLLINFLKK